MTLNPRDRWARAAAGWEARADWFRDATMPVTSWMIDAIAPQPGHAILDLAAGIGDTGFLAAELVEPGGQVITSDFAPEMLAAAQRRAERLGISNVRFRQMDANVPLDQPAASLDAVLCRWGYMLFNDGEAALRDTRRVLKQDGRVALAAWTGAEENLWSAAPVKILQRRGVIEAEQPGPGQFAWAREGEIAETLESAGFVEYSVESVSFSFHFSDIDDWWAAQLQTSTRIADADAQMDTTTRRAVLDDMAAAATAFEQDGGVVIPARTWVATATV
jgi:ubiquinone/menaquinone biosynthesis C-methylase UbiE